MADEVAPGPAPRDNSTVESRIARLEKKVEEITRRKSYPFSVAPDDIVMFRVAPDPSGATTESGAPRANVEIGFGDGQRAFASYPDPQNPAIQRAAFLDRAGSEMVCTDGYTGYGLYRPGSIGIFYIAYGGSATRWDIYQPTANNVWRTIYRGYMQCFNPAVFVGGQVEARSAGTACTAALRINYYRADNVFLRASPTVTASAAANEYISADVIDQFSLPQDMMNRNLKAEIDVCLISGANGANVASCHPAYFSGGGTYPGWDTA